jgi:hypothetical protein
MIDKVLSTEVEKHDIYNGKGIFNGMYQGLIIDKYE